MKYALKRINEGVQIDLDRIKEQVLRCDKLYSRASAGLFDMGFIDNPDWFNLEDYIEVLRHDYPEVTNLFKSPMNGHCSYKDPAVVSYICQRLSKEDSDSLLVNSLRLYLQALEAVTTIDALDTFLKVFKRNGKTVVKINPRLVIAGEIEVRSDFDMFNKVVKRIVAMEDDEGYKQVDFGDIVLKHLAKRVGVSEELFEFYKNKNKPLFLKDTSFEVECSLVSTICTGNLLLDGDFGAELTEVISKYYSDYYQNNVGVSVITSYEYQLYVEALDEMVARVTEFRNSLGDSFVKECYMSKTSVGFICKTDVSDYYDVPINTFGMFEPVDMFTGEEIGFSIREQGYCSTVITEEQVKSRGISIHGTFVEINGHSIVPLYRADVVKPKKTYDIVNKRYLRVTEDEFISMFLKDTQGVSVDEDPVKVFSICIGYISIACWIMNASLINLVSAKLDEAYQKMPDKTACDDDLCRRIQARLWY